MEKPDFYTVKDVAAKLSVKENTVRKWIAEGHIPAKRIDSVLLIPRVKFEIHMGVVQTSDNDPVCTFLERALEIRKEELQTETF